MVTLTLAIGMAIELADKRHLLPSRLRGNFKAVADADTKVVLLELCFPEFSKHRFQTVSNSGRIKFSSEADKVKLIRNSLYSLVIRAAYIAAQVLSGTSYQTVAVHVVQGWFDPATGTPKTGIICSLLSGVQELVSLDLSQVDPEVCFRHLKGIVVPSLKCPSSIRPIFALNKNDDRFIEAGI